MTNLELMKMIIRRLTIDEIREHEDCNTKRYKLLDILNECVNIELRYNDGSHYTKDEHGRFTGSTSSGGGSSGSTGGKSSGSNNKQTAVDDTGKVELVGQVDYNDKEAVINTLLDAEKEFVNLPYEKCRTVTSDGKVWDTMGTSGTVDNSAIENMGSSLKGSYSYHNHPKDETYFSFSGEDVGDFISKEEQAAIASDYKYIYLMKRRSDTVSASYNDVKQDFKHILKTEVYQKSWDSMIDIDENGNDETMKILANKYHFSYRRVLKNG